MQMKLTMLFWLFIRLGMLVMKMDSLFWQQMTMGMSRIHFNHFLGN